MERLTIKYGDGRYESINPIDIFDNEYSKANYDKLVKRLGEYEDLEEQEKLLKLPCAVGDTVYVIPSETNYKLNIINEHSENNRVYEQVVGRIEISNTGYLLVTCDGMASVVDVFYKKTWFLTREEAESALKKL